VNKRDLSLKWPKFDLRMEWDSKLWAGILLPI
jgi:hypothetical protein